MGCPHSEAASHVPRHLGLVQERQCLRLLRGRSPWDGFSTFSTKSPHLENTNQESLHGTQDQGSL